MTRVTVAIPTRNRVALLHETLDSALALDWDDLEVVVSDNCSEDGTAQYLQGVTDPRVRMLHQRTPLDMPGNWDACLAAATGELFLLLSDDDLIDPTFLRRTVEMLDPWVGLVATGVRFIDARGGVFRTIVSEDERVPAPKAILDHVRGRYTLVPSTTLLRTAGLRRVGGYAAGGYLRTADARAWFEIALGYREVAFVREALGAYRVHGDALTHLTDTSELLEEYARLWDATGALLEDHTRHHITRGQVVRIGRRRNLRGVGSEVLRRVRAGEPRVAGIAELVRTRELRRSPYGLGVLVAAIVKVITATRAAG